MLTKIYFTIWAAVGILTGILYLSGNLTMLAAVILGFVSFGLVFMGMMAVLPSAMAHETGARPTKAGPDLQRPETERTNQKVRRAISGLFTQDGIEIRRPNFH